MATLQKFKHIASQCAIAGSPTRSPSTSPVIHLRRRKTLRMLLGRPERRRFSFREDSPELREIQDRSPEKTTIRKEVRVRRKLKDLFVSSPPPDDSTEACDKRLEKDENEQHQGLLPLPPVGNGGAVFSSFRFRSGLTGRRGGSGSLRPVSGVFRYRLTRRAWRPMLVTIPE